MIVCLIALSLWTLLVWSTPDPEAGDLTTDQASVTPAAPPAS